MNNAEAEALLQAHLQSYRRRTYTELVALIRGARPPTVQLNGPSGSRYQIEVDILWDSRHDGTVRVIGAIDDGGWRALRPLTDGFIMAPDGSFIGE